MRTSDWRGLLPVFGAAFAGLALVTLLKAVCVGGLLEATIVGGLLEAGFGWAPLALGMGFEELDELPVALFPLLKYKLINKT